MTVSNRDMENAQSIVEAAVLVGLIAVISVAMILIVGTSASDFFSSISTVLGS